MKKIAILDFSTAIVYVREIPEHVEDEDSIISFFEESLDIRMKDCEYMIGENLLLDIIFKANEDCAEKITSKK